MIVAKLDKKFYFHRSNPEVPVSEHQYFLVYWKDANLSSVKVLLPLLSCLGAGVLLTQLLVGQRNCAGISASEIQRLGYASQRSGRLQGRGIQRAENSLRAKDQGIYQ